MSTIHKLLAVACLCLAFASTQAQRTPYKGIPSLVWPKLYDIEFSKTTDQQVEYDKPIFSQAAKSLAGKIVVVPGYIAPFESGIKSAHFMLSSLPLNACFFCGVGGPETVIEVYAKEPITFTQRPVEIKGKLKLNENDPDKMIYVLEEAELIGEVDF